MLKGMYSRFKKLNNLICLGVNTDIIQHLHERNNSKIATYLQKKVLRYQPLQN